MKKIILIIMLFAFNLAAHTVFYADASASGSGDGTTTALTGANCAFRTIAEMNANLYSNYDTLKLNRGDTFVGTLLPATADGMVITAYGTGALPIVDGNGAHAFRNLTTMTHLTISYIKFITSATCSTYLVSPHGNSTGFILENCEVDGTNMVSNHAEVVVTAADSVIIRDNYIHSSLEVGVYLGGDYGIVEGNTITGHARDGIKFNCVSSQTGCIARYNIITDCAIGIDLGETQHVDIHHNIIYESGGAFPSAVVGIKFEDDDTASPAASYINIFNNTIIVTASATANRDRNCIRLIEGSGGNSVIKNNIMMINGTVSDDYFITQNDSSVMPTFDNNLYFSNNTYKWRPIAGVVTTLTNWRGSASSPDTDGTTGDPLFADEFDTLSIGASSPAIDLGVSLTAHNTTTLTVDYNGVTLSGTADAGAYWYGSDGTTPLTGTDNFLGD